MAVVMSPLASSSHLLSLGAGRSSQSEEVEEDPGFLGMDEQELWWCLAREVVFSVSCHVCLQPCPRGLVRCGIVCVLTPGFSPHRPFPHAWHTVLACLISEQDTVIVTKIVILWLGLKDCACCFLGWPWLQTCKSLGCLSSLICLSLGLEHTL